MTTPAEYLEAMVGRADEFYGGEFNAEDDIGPILTAAQVPALIAALVRIVRSDACDVYIWDDERECPSCIAKVVLASLLPEEAPR